MTVASRRLLGLALFASVLVFSHLPAAAQIAKQSARRGAPVAVADPADDLKQNDPHLTFWQARKMIVAELGTAYFTAVDSSSYNFSFDSLAFKMQLPRQREFKSYTVDLKTLPKVIAQRGFAGMYRLKDEAGHDLPEPFKHIYWYGPGVERITQSLANALNRLREIAGEDGMKLRNFEKAAAEWRDASTKPELAEEVRAQQLLAENALKEENSGKALYHYERGIEFYPVWFEGRYNAALIAAELNYYSEAVEHMQAFLKLAPDSPEAPGARDQIVIWKDKAMEKSATSPAEQAQGRSLSRKK
jgi:tetratricopeptide (TPR) repeat protein